MSERRFFYLVPPERRDRLMTESLPRYLRRLLFEPRRRYPTGGIKVIYDHCRLLREAGYDAWPVHLGHFDVDWFDHGIDPLTDAEALAIMTPDDVLVVPERIPGAADRFPGRNRVVFAQNQGLVPAAIAGGRYEDRGFTDVLCCSAYVCEAIADLTTLPRHTVTNGIDTTRFRPDPSARQDGAVLYLKRKSTWRLGAAALDRLPGDVAAAIKPVGLPHSCSQAEMIGFYQRADIFMPLGFPEGFALPPLEAMACGAVVVGFAGGGGLTHMVDGVSALVVPDGDADALVEALTRIVRDPALKERLRAGGAEMAARFGESRMREELLSFARLMQAR